MAEAQYIIVIVQGTVHSTEGAGLIYLCGRGRAWRDTQSLKIRLWTNYSRHSFCYDDLLRPCWNGSNENNEWSFSRFSLSYLNIFLFRHTSLHKFIYRRTIATSFILLSLQVKRDKEIKNIIKFILFLAQRDFICSVSTEGRNSREDALSLVFNKTHFRSNYPPVTAAILIFIQDLHGKFKVYKALKTKTYTLWSCHAGPESVSEKKSNFI